MSVQHDSSSVLAMATNTLHNALCITQNLFKHLRLRIAIVRSASRQPNIWKHTSTVSCDLVFYCSVYVISKILHTKRLLLLLKTVTFRLTVLWLWMAGRSSCCWSELTRQRSLLIDWSIVRHCELELATSDLIRTCVLVSQRATFSMNSRSAASDLNLSWSTSKQSVGRSQYDTRCYFNVCSKADISQLNISPNLPHGNDN